MRRLGGVLRLRNQVCHIIVLPLKNLFPLNSGFETCFGWDPQHRQVLVGAKTPPKPRFGAIVERGSDATIVICDLLARTSTSPEPTCPSVSSVKEHQSEGMTAYLCTAAAHGSAW